MMKEIEIVKCLELANLVGKIEIQVRNIEKGDLNCQLTLLNQFPYFDMKGVAELRNDALNEYYVMLVTAFFNTCKLTFEATDNTILDLINDCVVRLNGVLKARLFDVQLLPLAKTLYDLHDCANKKLLKLGLSDYAKNLEELKKRIFMDWSIVQ